MRQEVTAGLLVIAIGIATLWLVARLPPDASGGAGTAYLPRLVAYGLLATGAFIGLRGVRSPVKMAAWHWRTLGALVLAVLTFALLVEHAGLVIASGCCAFVGSLAARFPSWRHRVVTVVVICTLAVVIFVYLLGLNISVWPKWIS